MKKSRFTEEQTIRFFKKAEAGMPIKELCRNSGFSDATYCKWRTKFGMTAHIRLDAGSGLAHTVVGTAANVNDVT